jgi:hypothetical protein
LGFTDVQRIVAIWSTDTKRGQKQVEACYADLVDWSSQTSVLDGVALASSVNLDFPITGDGPPRQVDGSTVSGSFFRLLGAKAAMGRLLTEKDDQPNAPLRIVISHRLWQTHFGGDPSIIGRQVRGGVRFARRIIQCTLMRLRSLLVVLALVAATAIILGYFFTHRPTDKAIRGSGTIESTDVDVSFQIAGRVTDELGEPLAGVRVQALRYQYLPNGRRQLTPVGMSGFFGPVSNDLGEVRLYSLMPGTYVLSATPADIAMMAGPSVASAMFPVTVPPVSVIPERRSSRLAPT